jgi:hypothetical protein
MPAYVKEERTKAERNLIQGGFAPKPPADPFPQCVRVWSVRKRLLSRLVPASSVQTDDNSPLSLRIYFACRLQSARRSTAPWPLIPCCERCARHKGMRSVRCSGDSAAFLMTGSKRANHGWTADTSLSLYKMINRQLLKNGLPVCAASSQYSKANEHSP